MCGITGAVSSRQFDLDSMVQSIIHRGPDFQSSWREGPVGLGHARLSILDLSSEANQPMVSRCGRYVLAYNGEVYNFKLFKKELESEGVIFRTHSDTEVLLEGYARWGQALFSRLNGMFAVVLYDRLKKQLLLVRDRFGIKPLYYFFEDASLVFGSEIKSLLTSGLVARSLNFQGMHEYLHFSSTLGENTFYEGIKKLEPGHMAIYSISDNSFKIHPYAVNYDLPEINDSLDDAIAHIRTLFENSVKSQLVADVPVGIFLSGGIDSTAITAFASKHYSGKLKTFSAGFDFDRGVNELSNAKFVANHFGTDHHELHIKGVDVIHTLEALGGYFDQPFGDAANIPLYLMGKEIGGKQKVILQGDGGDELFAGYRQYFRVKNERSFRLLSRLITQFGGLVPKSSKYYRMMRSMYAMAQNDPALVPARIYSSEMLWEPPQRLFKHDWQERLNVVDPFSRNRKFHDKFSHLDLLQELLYTDMNVLLPDQYLEKVDRATMATSLEVRVPFLDNDLAAYAMALPSSYKVRGKEKKFLLKKAFEGVVPEKILYGPKRGFGVPFQYWLRTSLKEFMVENIRASNCYSSEVEKMMGEHISGKRDHGYVLWKLLNFSIWFNKNSDLDNV
ncbi:asparagine synthase (glutamine-hydrolyzing) [Marinobacter sp.]|uniref:asparagine synthase (glutamine-hydrolyzing) n=1 Tax=Marinobacter sp. TaxID=50741 RepID=UPI00384D10CD